MKVCASPKARPSDLNVSTLRILQVALLLLANFPLVSANDGDLNVGNFSPNHVVDDVIGDSSRSKENTTVSASWFQDTPLSAVRFSKVFFESDGLYAQYQRRLPLTSSDYPIQQSTAEMLRSSYCWSVVMPEDLRPRTAYSPTRLEVVLNALNLARGPSHPPEDLFWRELDYVIKMQMLRRTCGHRLLAKDVFPVPQTWHTFTLDDAAEAVHNEYPAYHQAQHIQTLFSSGQYGFEGYKKGVSVDHRIIPIRSKVEFLNGPIMLADLSTWAFSVVGIYNFLAKWKYGRVRPEEVAWKIKTGEFGTYHGVPQYIVDQIQSMGMNRMEAFTAFDEGAPTHPAWPAMHSAASNLSLYLATVLDLTQEQFEEAKRVDYAVSFARTIAGVHYVSDNIDGLNLGQEVVARELPYHLYQTYGSDPEFVKAKIAALRFDWNDYDHTIFRPIPKCPGLFDSHPFLPYGDVGASTEQGEGSEEPNLSNTTNTTSTATITDPTWNPPEPIGWLKFGQDPPRLSVEETPTEEKNPVENSSSKTTKGGKASSQGGINGSNAGKDSEGNEGGDKPFDGAGSRGGRRTAVRGALARNRST